MDKVEEVDEIEMLRGMWIIMLFSSNLLEVGL